MTCLTILVGIPACGKTTFAREIRDHDVTVVSSDDIREELTGDINNQDQNYRVFAELDRRIKNKLAQGFEVVVDATNLKKAYRKGLLEIAQKEGCPAIAVRFRDSANFDLCQERNLTRERVVPEYVMNRFHAMFLENCSVEQMESEGWRVLEYPK